jgi:ketosteroid isomerase-like protein
MSQDNVEVARAYYADIDRTLKAYWASPEVALSESAETQAIVERLHPEVVWKPPFRSADEGYRGREGIRRALDELVEAIEEWRITVEEVVEAGEGRVLLTASSHVRGKGSGVTFDQRVFTVITFRDGKIAQVQDFTQRSQALETAGLGE